MPSSSATHRLATRTKIAILVAVAMLLSLPLVPSSAAQDDGPPGTSWPSPEEQLFAAAQLFAQLNAEPGDVDPNDLRMPRALGPAPWLSYAPDREQSTIDAWVELSQRAVDPNGEALRLAPLAGIAIRDIEAIPETGRNDTIADGQLVSGFGTGSDDAPFARVAGFLGGSLPPPPPPPLDCPSIEEDGTIFDANETPLNFPPAGFVLCGGTIGDSEFGATSGDVDFFRLNVVPEGALIVVDAGSFDPDAFFDLTIAVYNQAGQLLGSLNDSDSLPDSVLTIAAPADGIYYAAVAGVNSLPADPFDPSSGPGATFVGSYLVRTGIVPPPEPPPVPACVSAEPDSSIGEANQIGTPPGPGPLLCVGSIGDDPDFSDSGDFDFFAIEVPVPGSLFVAAGSQPILGDSLVSAVLYDTDGSVIAVSAPDGGGFESFELIVEQPGTYFVMVTSVGVFPANPLDPASGPGAGPTADYEVVIGFLPLLGPPPIPPEPPLPVPTPSPDQPNPVPTAAPQPPPLPVPLPPAAAARVRPATEADLAAVAGAFGQGWNALDGPCISVEDDGALDLAKNLDLERNTTAECIGTYGDGPFGSTSGDFDLFALVLDAGELVDASVNSPVGSEMKLYDSTGTLLLDAASENPITVGVTYEASTSDTYYLAVNSFGIVQGDPTVSDSGSGTTGVIAPYALTISRVAPLPLFDTDVYLVDLAVGDALGVGFNMSGAVTIIDPAGQASQNSFGRRAFIYPLESALRSLGAVGADFVASNAGIHAVIVDSGFGPYEGELRVKRAGLSDEPGDDTQILFLDFNGGQFNDAIFDPFAPDDTGIVRTLSPIGNFLGSWELTGADEDAVIDSVIATFAESLLEELHETGGNGNRDATGIGGELDIEILNSRDHADPWGEPNVSRIIIGGSSLEAGIETVGIAESIDPGNFDTTETALVLLDRLSAPPGFSDASLNVYGIAPGSTKVDLVGRGIGLIAAHEAGHFLGNWHTAAFNETPNIMDEGGDLPTLLGVGPDFVFGSADDSDTDFTVDVYSINEGLVGREATQIRTAQALSTGQTSVSIEPEFPADGVYLVVNLATGRTLDADPNGNVDTSLVPRTDDEWRLISLGDGVYNLRNAEFGTYLDADSNGVVDQSQTARSDDRWRLEPQPGGGFALFNLDRDAYLFETESNNVGQTKELTDAARWSLVPVGGPVVPTPQPTATTQPTPQPTPTTQPTPQPTATTQPTPQPTPTTQPTPQPTPTTQPGGVSPYTGRTVALRNEATSRWLDTDSDGDVDQSVNQREDDVWLVEAVGNGNVYLINTLTGRYLDADLSDNNVETSRFPSLDDEWELVDRNGTITLRNIVHDEYLHGEGAALSFNATRQPNLSASTNWTVTFIGVQVE